MTLADNRRQAKNSSAIEQFLAKTPVHIAVVAIAVIWTVPTFGLLISSLRDQEALLQSGWWTIFWQPGRIAEFDLENYITVLTSQGMGQAFLNSLVISIPATVIPIAIATFAAYALAWMEFPGRQWLFVTVVGLLVVPLQMTLIPILRAYTQLNLSGTFLAVWLAHAAYGLPLGIYLLRNYIGALPRDLIEAAEVDGASHLKIFTRLIVPLSMPAIASFAVFQFLWVWNDLLVALVYLGGNQNVAPVTLVLRNLVGDRGQDWHLLTAGAFVSMIVPLLVFFGLQRYFVRGLLAGSVKG
ncbi:carbohydrate ABC transporter permease [Romeria aff. gracilis LEGE 07310]|uniref:Carbohydrate ABC transporter permease n=1 Tax=Vasconcelosia minhoensis LEGE 07310 TaxID=915328 RepID=A0A8J7ALA3_9CYAN|nr:carbohydrate ABC transporter permease [Romeria gracilis]MBE9079903.1 carbohydrate ABC transporter permease [Romeria aff. gracilis LEGE 07310]